MTTKSITPLEYRSLKPIPYLILVFNPPANPVKENNHKTRQSITNPMEINFQGAGRYEADAHKITTASTKIKTIIKIDIVGGVF